jgi:hypothetical protein
MKPKLRVRILSAVCLAPVALWAQQPPASPPGQSSSQQAGEKHGKYANHIILSGTVFTAQGFALRGAQVQVRRAGEKKVLAENVSNGAGEFWVHVPRGVDYEMSAKAPGFEAQTLKIEASSDGSQELVFRMKPFVKGKK